MSPKAAPDYEGLAKAARGIAQAENLSKAMATVANAATDLAELCWTPGCDKPQSTERIGYWCTEHHDERRARIKAEMERIANDSQGNPRKAPDTRCLGITAKGTQCTRNGQPTASGGYRCKTHLGAERFDRRVA